MKKIALLALLLTCFGWASAQVESSNFTATGRGGVGVTLMTDYQAVGINPANLGMYKIGDGLENHKVFSIGIAEGVYSTFSTALERDDLRETFFSLEAIQNPPQLSAEQKAKAAFAFSGEGIKMNFDVAPLGLAVTPNEKIGGFGFAWRERFGIDFALNEDMAGILFQGYNYSKYFDSLAVNGGDTTGYSTIPSTFSNLFDGSRISMNWYREFGLSYGRIIINEENFKLYGGAGLKYLQGMAYLDVESKTEGLDAVSAFTPGFGINFGASTPSSVPGSGYSPVGSGWGVEAGLTAVIGEKFRVGISATDIGSITWNGNVYSANDTIFNALGSNGLDSYNLLTEIDSIIGEDGLFQWQGEEKITTYTPAKLRAGVSYDLVKQVTVSADIILPLNSEGVNLDNPYVGLGVDVRPIQWLRLSTGFTAGGGTSYNVPLGIYVIGPKNVFEIGVASRDAVTWFIKPTPMLSLGLGLLRFKF